MQPEQQQRIMGYFIEEAKDHLNTIEQGLLNLQSTIDDPEMGNEVFRAAHSVKGGAAMLGISSVQKTAHRLEDYFKVLKEVPVSVDQKLESLFLRVFDTLQELLEQLEGPFGLTEDVATTKMAEVDPVFEQLQEHIESLVGQPPQQQTSSIPDSANSITSTSTRGIEPPQVSQRFGGEVTAHLREMLQTFKQTDNSTTRQQLQAICNELAGIGEAENLNAWCQLVEVAKQAITNFENSYRTLAPITIKELKHAQEMVLAGKGNEITVSDELKYLAPDLATVSIEDSSFDDDLEDLLDISETPSSLPEDSDLKGDRTLFEGNLDGSDARNRFEGEDLFAGIDDLAEHSSSIPNMDGAEADLADLAGPPISKPAEPVGPEVGMAELNSLADLFEGEALDLDETWQEEELIQEKQADGVDNISARAAEDEVTNDFSDLLFDDEVGDLLSSTSQQDLTSLLEDDFSEIDSQELGFPAIDDSQTIDLGLSEMTSDSLSNDFGVNGDEDLAATGERFVKELDSHEAPPEEVSGGASLSELFEGLDESDLFPDDEITGGEGADSLVTASDRFDVEEDESAEDFLDATSGIGTFDVSDGMASETEEENLSDLWGNNDELELDSLLENEEQTDDSIAHRESEESSDLNSLFSDISDSVSLSEADSEVDSLDEKGSSESGGHDSLSREEMEEQATVYQEISPGEQVHPSEGNDGEVSLDLDEDLLSQQEESHGKEIFSETNSSSPDNVEDLFGQEETLSGSVVSDAESVAEEFALEGVDDDINAEMFGEPDLQMPDSASGIDEMTVEDDLNSLFSGEQVSDVSVDNSADLFSDSASDLSDLFSEKSDDMNLELEDSTIEDESFSLDSTSNNLGDLFASESEDGADIGLDLNEPLGDPWVSDHDSTNVVDTVSDAEAGNDLFEVAETDLDLGLDVVDVSSQAQEVPPTLDSEEAALEEDDLVSSASDLIQSFSQDTDDFLATDEALSEEGSEASGVDESDLTDNFFGDFGSSSDLEAELGDFASSEANGLAGEGFSEESDLFGGLVDDDLDMFSSPDEDDSLSNASLDVQDDSAGTELDTHPDGSFGTGAVDANEIEASFDNLDTLSGEGEDVEEMPAVEDDSDLDSLLPDEDIESALVGEDLEDSSDLDDLDSLLEDSEGASVETGDDAFGDLDSLLSEGEESFSVEGEKSDDFDDLASLLGEGGEVSAEVGASSGDFDDLEALLDDSSHEPLSTTNSSEDLEVADLGTGQATPDDGFGDLEKLLEDADQTMGGSPTTKSVPRSSQPITARRRRATFEQTMRVPVKNLDNLNNLVGELVVNRNSLEQGQERLRQFLDNLLHQVQQLSDVGQRMQDLYERSLLESSLLANRQSYRQQSSDDSVSNVAHATGMNFDALEMDRFTGFHTLSQEMIEMIVRVREASSDIEFLVSETDQIARTFRQVTTQLQEGLTRSRMVPFSQAADRLPRAVRDIAIKCGKQAKLQIEGRDILIDKVIMEQLYDPMTHLVNNAITHGIEEPHDREQDGKPEVGTITVRAFRQGNQTVISVSDDGAGIPVDRVKTKAVQKGLITNAEAREMPDVEVYELLFHPGFSTKDQADDFAGRGVGMDVVRTSLSEIRGTISTDSEVGKGTTFIIRLPLTLSICKALCCISDRAQIAFPMDGVEDMLDVPRDRIQENEENQPCLLWRDNLLPFRPLKELLTYNRRIGRSSVYGATNEEDIISVVVLRSGGNFLALQVDRVLGEQEIVIKQLEGPVPKPVGVAGATVLGDGRIMPIADVLELIDISMGRVRREGSGTLWDRPDVVEPLESAAVKTEPTVLIVDDSITVRELLSMTFNKAGYRVEQARDGQEAWEKLRSGLPCDIVFCDIEMPRMDGLELLSRLQKDSALNSLPIAMLTSRGADRHRQMAVQLGASGYFTKPYLEEALLDAAQRMLKGEVLVAQSKSEATS